MKLIEIQISEIKELEPLLVQDLSVIEDGLKILTNQLSIGEAGRPDVLAIDEDRNLVLIELKNELSGIEHLNQALRYYDSLNDQIAWLSRAYPDINPENKPRILLVSVDFDDDVKRLVKYLAIDVELILYKALKNTTSNDIAIYCEKLEIEPEETIIFRSIEDIVNYCDQNIQIEFKKCLDFLENEGYKLKPWQGGSDYWIECFYDNEEYGYFQARKKYFNVQYWDEENERFVHPYKKIYSFEQFKSEIKDKDLI